MTPEQVADLQWLVGQAYKAPPGWWNKGDGKRMDRIQALFAELTYGHYTPVPSPMTRRKREDDDWVEDDD